MKNKVVSNNQENASHFFLLSILPRLEPSAERGTLMP